MNGFTKVTLAIILVGTLAAAGSAQIYDVASYPQPAMLPSTYAPTAHAMPVVYPDTSLGVTAPTIQPHSAPMSAPLTPSQSYGPPAATWQAPSQPAPELMPTPGTAYGSPGTLLPARPVRALTGTLLSEPGVIPAPAYGSDIPGYGTADCQICGSGVTTIGHHRHLGIANKDCLTKPCRPLWYANAAGLFLARENEDHYYFSYDDFNEAIQRTDYHDADFGLAGGFEVSVGRYIHCWESAVEFVYWGLYPEDDSTVTLAGDVTGNLNGILNWDDLTYNGANADASVNNAAAHAVFRDSDYHNIEINFLNFWDTAGKGDCSIAGFRNHWLAGIRYFHFRDELLFIADTVDANFTGAVEEINYNIETTNHLIGVQLGNMIHYDVTNALAIRFGAKAGLFGNHITHESVIGGAAGLAVINNGPNAGTAFYVDNSESAASLLAELDLALRYAVTPRWTMTAGYRVLGASGISLPTNQIYPDLRGIQDVQNIDTTGNLVLHGGYVGGQFNY